MLTPEEEQPELNLLPREDNESDINNLVERLAKAADGDNARTEFATIVNTYVPGIDVEGILEARQQLKALGNYWSETCELLF